MADPTADNVEDNLDTIRSRGWSSETKGLSDYDIRRIVLEIERVRQPPPPPSDARGRESADRVAALERASEQAGRANHERAEAQKAAVARKPHEDVARAQESATRSVKVSTVWTVTAAVAALLALVMSLAAYRLAFSDDEHDRRWRAEQRAIAAEQLRVLEDIRERLPQLR